MEPQILDDNLHRLNLDYRPFVVGALLEFLAEVRGLQRGRLSETPVVQHLIESDPFAFLVAVLLDQGVPAERAWAAPETLRHRLGHLQPLRLQWDPAPIHAAFSERPMPHRFPRLAAGWVYQAARLVARRYRGDAARIWSDGPSAYELRQRLEEFPGIGQKKAAMAVEILASANGPDVRELSGSDVAYDVHVRRVFLRTGLANGDTVHEVVAAARELHPARPGALDLPAWLIGREWCRPRRPDCAACPISWACPSSPGAGDAVKPAVGAPLAAAG